MSLKRSNAAEPEHHFLERFCKVVLDSGQTPQLINRVAADAGFVRMCRWLAAGDEDAAFAAFCKHGGIDAGLIRRRLQPVARALRLDCDAAQDKVDYYALLGVATDADGQTIKRAFRQKAHALHPDKGGDGHDFAALQTAYVHLSDPDLRRRHDRRPQPGETWVESPPPDRPRSLGVGRTVYLIVVLVAALAAAAFGFDYYFQESSFSLRRAALQSPGNAAQQSARPVSPSVQEASRQARRPVPSPLREASDTPAEGASTGLGMSLAFTDAPADAGVIDHPYIDLSGFGPVAAPPAPEPGAAPGGGETAGAAAVGETKVGVAKAGVAAPEKEAAAKKTAGKKTAAAVPETDRGVQSSRKAGQGDGRQLAAAAPAARIERPLPAVEPKAGSLPASAPAEGRMEKRVRLFLKDYCAAYSNKDLEKFSALFTDDSTEQGKPFASVLPLYRWSFDQTAALDYSIRLIWFKQGQEATELHGAFTVTYTMPDGRMGSRTGSIDMELMDGGDRLRVRKLAYTYQ